MLNCKQQLVNTLAPCLLLLCLITLTATAAIAVVAATDIAADTVAAATAAIAAAETVVFNHCLYSFETMSKDITRFADKRLQ